MATRKSSRKRAGPPARSSVKKSPGAKRQPVEAERVELVAGKGAAGRGGGTGGHYWHIHVDGTRVGHIFINIIRDEHFGEHPSVQIHINQTHRGRQIGRAAYRLACEQSGYPTVYAHMRKSNTASRRAAEEAGFEPVTNAGIKQLSMIWRRKASQSGQ